MPLVPAAVSAICIGPPQSNRPDTTSSIEEDLLGLEDLSLRPPDPPRKKRGEEWNEKEPVAGEN